MKISARKQVVGMVTEVTPGSVNASVKFEIGDGNIITSSITNEAVADLGLAVGDQVTAIIKSSDVLIGK